MFAKDARVDVRPDTGYAYSYASTTLSRMAVGDVDGDGDVEVLMTGAGGLHVRHYNGQSFDGIPDAIGPDHPSTEGTPVLADLDRDGDIEVTVHLGPRGAPAGVFGRHDPAHIEWGMYRHDPYRTGSYSADVSLPLVWQMAPVDRVFVRMR